MLCCSGVLLVLVLKSGFLAYCFVGVDEAVLYIVAKRRVRLGYVGL